MNYAAAGEAAVDSNRSNTASSKFIQEQSTITGISGQIQFTWQLKSGDSLCIYSTPR